MGSVRAVAPRTAVTLGIIKDVAFKHGHFEAACMELGVPYRLIDITGADWMDQVRGSECQAYVVWPSNITSVNKSMFDERLKVLAEDMGRVLFPSYKSLWLYESKRRTNDWFAISGVPHPRTWVCFDRDRAVESLGATSFPLIFKTDLGSTASGVRLVRDKKEAERLIRLCFGKGYLARRHDSRDRDWGYVLFQEYIVDAREWRMVRIGRSFFGHQKLRKGQFHSGSRLVGWGRPPDALLDFCREVTDKGPFLSMNVDVLERKDGTCLASELHPVFGSKNPEQMILDGKPGRFVWEDESQSWQFQEGHFCRNSSCNLRVLTLLELLRKPLREEP